jgi:hypothetical protein
MPKVLVYMLKRRLQQNSRLELERRSILLQLLGGGGIIPAGFEEFKDV